MKILVNAPSGIQEIIELKDGGGYFDPTRVLWDERVDGVMPDITLGAMVRVGNALQVDAALGAATVVVNTATKSAEVRTKRNGMIAECDWTQVADVPVDKAAWAIYRQSLRDVPLQSGFPFNVIWPVAPI